MSENFKAFMELDESQYLNEYVVIVKGRVFLHGENAEELLAETKKQFPDEVPLIAKIPPEEVLIL